MSRREDSSDSFTVTASDHPELISVLRVTGNTERKISNSAAEKGIDYASG